MKGCSEYYKLHNGKEGSVGFIPNVYLCTSETLAELNHGHRGSKSRLPDLTLCNVFIL